MLPALHVDFTPASDILAAYRYAAQKAPGLTRTAFKVQTLRIRQRLLERLRDEPGPPDYPIQWKSLKQKIFVIAMLRATGNLPYERTHQLSAGWKILDNFKEFEGTLEAVNEVPYVVFVQGDWAQPFHIDRWTQVDDIFYEEMPVIEDAYIETWFAVIDSLE